jgi:SAM-dependent methyltransferase/uncharacterized protein YbaR (Trm112 family)
VLVSDWLLESLACPRDRMPVTLARDELECACGHRYPVVQGIPIMLLEEVAPTLPSHFRETLEHVSTGDDQDGMANSQGVFSYKGVHPFVEQEIVATCGNMYKRLPDGLTRYPIPHLPLANGEDATFLDVGSNWGRWALSASKRGYRAVGLDPSLKAALAGAKVARELGQEVHFVVGDARCLPFEEKCFHTVFSYSVLQHFSKPETFDALRELSRVNCSQGTVLVQMPNRYGLRQMLNRVRDVIKRNDNVFRVRYWSPAELRSAFSSIVGPTSLSVDGFFSLNPRIEDSDLLAKRYSAIVSLSKTLKRFSQPCPWLVLLADSLWVESKNESLEHPSPNSIDISERIS